MQNTIAFVKSDSMANITCPSCNSSRILLVTPYKDKKHTLRIRCGCKEVFLALLEFRRHKRRRVTLKGTFSTAHQHLQREGQMVISDISKGGIRCQVSNSAGLEEGYVLSLDYKLCDIGNSEINIKAVIRHIQGMTIGCEFLILPE